MQQEKISHYDIIIIGAGPAGLSAALFAARRKVSVLVISEDLGGQASSTYMIENYPGMFSVGGKELMEKFYEHAKKNGAHFEFAGVKDFQNKDDFFIVSTQEKKFEARALIFACGLAPRKLEIKGEEKFFQKGIFYEFFGNDIWFRGKNVVIVGGGSSAFTGLLYIAHLAKKVFLIHRTEQFRAEPILIERAKSCKNVEWITNARVKKIEGKDKIKNIVIETNNALKKIQVDALYVAIGFQPKSSWFQDKLLCDQKKEICVDEIGAASLSGIFAAGDVTTLSWKQVVISAGEGAKAALSAVEYLFRKDGKKFQAADWT